jgi:hypothetical protein
MFGTIVSIKQSIKNDANHVGTWKPNVHGL